MNKKIKIELAPPSEWLVEEVQPEDCTVFEVFCAAVNYLTATIRRGTV